MPDFTNPGYGRRTLGLPDPSDIYPEGDQMRVSLSNHFNTSAPGAPVVFAPGVTDYMVFEIDIPEIEDLPSANMVGVYYDHQGVGYTGSNNIVSNFFTSTTVQDSRNFLPHTILKHELVLYKDGVEIYRIPFFNDLTRGDTRRYPFSDVPFETGSQAEEHDLQVFFQFESSGTLTSESNNGTVYSINDWLPDLPQTSISCSLTAAGIVRLGLTNHPATAPGYLTNGNIGGVTTGHGGKWGGTDTSFIHKYIIDKPFDLSLINKKDRIIYNPSEVDIDISSQNKTLIFPSGYTFKTVYGNLPSSSTSNQYNQTGIYDKNLNQAPIPNDINSGFHKGKYYVKSGNTLYIEDCVTLIDAIIHIDSGGTVNYNSDNTEIIGSAFIPQGGQLIDRASGSPSNCGNLCLSSLLYAGGNNQYKNLIVPSGTTHTFQAGNYEIFGDIIIEPNAVVQVQPGATLNFGPNSGIYVKANGTFQVNGTVSNGTALRPLCDGFWDGITTESTSNELATAKVELNYCLVDRARTAVRNYTYEPTIHEYGGIVSANNVTIQNSLRGFDLRSRSYIQQNGFGVELFNVNQFWNDNLPYNRISDLVIAEEMYAVKGIDLNTDVDIINNYDVSNYMTGLMPHQRPKGFWFKESIASLSTCNLTNLSEGYINATGTATGMPNSLIKVVNNTFNDVVNSVLFRGYHWIRIMDNTLSVPTSEQTALYQTNLTHKETLNKPFGIFLEDCSGYLINGNTISSPSLLSSDPNCTFCNYGVVIDNTYGSGMALSNSFNGLNISLQVQGKNKGSQNSDSLGPFIYIDVDRGFEAFCNDFNGSEVYDFVLVDDPEYISTGISSTLRDQGLCDAYPTFNEYSSCTSNINVASATTQYTPFNYAHATSFFGLSWIQPCSLNVNINGCDESMIIDSPFKETSSRELYCNYYSDLYAPGERGNELRGQEYERLLSEQQALIRIIRNGENRYKELAAIQFRKRLVLSSIVYETINANQPLDEGFLALVKSDSALGSAEEIIRYLKATDREAEAFDHYNSLSEQFSNMELDERVRLEYQLGWLTTAEASNILNGSNVRWINQINEGYKKPVRPCDLTGTAAKSGQGSNIISNSKVQLNNQSTLSVYPNPSSGEINLKLKASKTLAACGSVQVFTLQGQLIYSLDNANLQEGISFNINSSGTYILKYTDTKGRSAVERVIIN